jgi:hypothetical protein
MAGMPGIYYGLVELKINNQSLLIPKYAYLFFIIEKNNIFTLI